jgi:hypothetical protein
LGQCGHGRRIEAGSGRRLRGCRFSTEDWTASAAQFFHTRGRKEDHNSFPTGASPTEAEG